MQPGLFAACPSELRSDRPAEAPENAFKQGKLLLAFGLSFSGRHGLYFLGPAREQNHLFELLAALLTKWPNAQELLVARHRWKLVVGLC